jgi:hypothetical protein
VTVTLSDEVTVITKLIVAEQLFRLTCENVMIVPAGQVDQVALMLDGPILATPEAFSTEVPVEPVKVDQERIALGVPVKLMVEADPGHKEDEEVSEAVGKAFTVIVPVAFTFPHPPVRGIL